MTNRNMGMNKGRNMGKSKGVGISRNKSGPKLWITKRNKS